MPPTDAPAPDPAGRPATVTSHHDPKDASARSERRLHRPHRVTALADGVFAIAMTLLALEIRVPDEVANEEEFVQSIGTLLAGLGVFALAFLITGQYWLGHHRMMSYVHTVDWRGVRLSVLALLGVCALPVAANLITRWAVYPQAVAIACGILIVTSLLSVRLYRHLLRPEFSDVDPDERRRILIAPLFNIAIYVITVPVAFLLQHLGISSGYSVLLWFLLSLNGVLLNRLVGRTR